eukprot:969738-Rhodomonas_salina.1
MLASPASGCAGADQPSDGSTPPTMRKKSKTRLSSASFSEDQSSVNPTVQRNRHPRAEAEAGLAKRKHADERMADIVVKDTTAPALDKRGREVRGTVLDDGVQLPPSNVAPDEYINADSNLLEIQSVLLGPFLDEQQQSAYLCTVNCEDESGELRVTSISRRWLHILDATRDSAKREITSEELESEERERNDRDREKARVKRKRKSVCEERKGDGGRAATKGGLGRKTWGAR